LRLCYEIGADDPGARRAVLDDEALAQALHELLREDARHHVGAAAGGEGTTTRTARAGYSSAALASDAAQASAAIDRISMRLIGPSRNSA